MDTKVLITNTRENELQFDIIVEGTSVEGMRVRFVIKDEGVEHVFSCVQSATAKQLTVIIPKLSYLKPGSYNFYIEVITNGYYFEPYSDILEVIAEPIVRPSGTETRLPVPVIDAIAVKGGKTVKVQGETKSPNKDNAIKDVLKRVNITSLEVKPAPSPMLKKRNTANTPAPKKRTVVMTNKTDK